MNYNRTLINAVVAISAHELQFVYDRKHYEEITKTRLANELARFILQERPELVEVSETGSRDGIVKYEVRAHLMSPAELRQIIQEALTDQAISSMLVSKLIQQEEP